MTDAEIRADLMAIDLNSEIEVTAWEADFIESILFKTFAQSPLTEKQRAKAIKLIEMYGR